MWRETEAEIYAISDTSGTYGWVTNPETVKQSVDWQLKALKTNYIDFKFIHCLNKTPN